MQRNRQTFQASVEVRLKRLISTAVEMRLKFCRSTAGVVLKFFQPCGWIQPLQPHFNRSLLFKILYLKVPLDHWNLKTQEIRIALWGLLSRVTKRKEGGEWSPLNLCLHMACVLCVCVCVCVGGGGVRVCVCVCVCQCVCVCVCIL